MPSHIWGDETFDWSALNESIYYCMDFWKKWGRIGSHGKEKYGSFRHHTYFWDGGIWSLFWPGYVSIKPGFWSFIYFKVDRYFTRKFTHYTGLHRLGIWYQAQIYNYALQTMCKKFPHITDELISDSDVPQFIKPGIFGKVDGQKIHDKYWTKCE